MRDSVYIFLLQFGSIWSTFRENFGSLKEQFENILIRYWKTKSMFLGGWTGARESRVKDCWPWSKFFFCLFQVIQELRDKNGDVTQATAALFAKSLKFKWKLCQVILAQNCKQTNSTSMCSALNFYLIEMTSGWIRAPKPEHRNR